MNTWMLIAIFLHTAGLMAFGGGLLWFILVLGRADRASGLEGSRVADDAFRVTSMGMSVGLTALIAGGLLRYYLLHHAFRWGTGSPYETLHLLKILSFLAAWIAWGWLEVVIMHPFRRDLPEPGAPPSPEYIQARRRVRRALKGQLALFLWILFLGAAAQAAH
jgi:hypothetical protein